MAPMMPMNRIMSTVEYKNMRFVICDAPTDANLSLYLHELQQRNVTDIFRVCEPTYRAATAAEAGIAVHEHAFADGTFPPAEIISAFLALCNLRFPGGLNAPVVESSSVAIGIHCVAGLGRAPILVAIALIESGMAPIEAIEFIRARRRGAFNTVQLQYLVDVFKPSFSAKKKSFSFPLSFKKKAASPTPSLVGSDSPVLPDLDGDVAVAVAGERVAPVASPKSFKWNLFARRVPASA
ncbi:UNVERIFIED_CONTAM: Protein tyrosine phosphatase prl-1 [Siphonaria sp. JEL0065]|nr:Protein tyrosine phosphatase prl-1 [Siphonaria sp. JEL0065]